MCRPMSEEAFEVINVGISHGKHEWLLFPLSGEEGNINSNNRTLVVWKWQPGIRAHVSKLIREEKSKSSSNKKANFMFCPTKTIAMNFTLQKNGTTILRG